MSTTTQDRSRGGSSDPADILTEQLLSGRDILTRAANGHTKAVSDPYAAQVRRDMRQGRSAEFKRLRAVAICDLKDGVPFPLVVAPFRQFITDLEMEAVTLHREKTERPLPALVRTETKAQSALDLAQLRVVESPTSTQALEDALREAGMYRSALDAFTAGCERTLSVIRCGARRVYGARTTTTIQVIR